MWYESEPSPTYHNLRNSSYSFKLSYTTDSSTPQVNLPRLGPTIAPTGSSEESSPSMCTAHILGRQATLYTMVTFRLLMYKFMGWIPAASIYSTNEGYPHYPPNPLFAVIPVIRHAAWWWNPSRNLSISPVTTQLLMLYKSTD